MQSIKATRLRIEKFVYKKGTNVALFNAEQSKEYKKFKEDLQKALMAQIRHIADRTETINTLLLWTKAAQPDNPQLIKEVSIALADETLDNQDIEISGYLTWAGEQGGQAALDKLGVDAIFGLVNKELLDYFDDYTQLLIQTLDETTKKWIAETLQNGKTQGLTPDQISNLLVDEGKGITKIRAERIVLTETAKAMSRVELETYRRYGVEEKIWRTSRDERVCPVCAPMDGERRKVKDNFSQGIEGPPAHVSCRCYMEQVVPDNWETPTTGWTGE